MKKILFIPGIMLLSYHLSAQHSANGSITIPVLQSVDVVLLNEKPADFSSITNYANGIEIISYGKMVVKSNCTWLVSARINEEALPPNERNKGLVSIRVAGSNKYIPLSGNLTPILVSNNTNIRNEYLIDLRIDPKLNFKAGAALLDLSFKVAPR